MHRNACGFANGIEALNDHFGIIANLVDDLTMIIARYAAHIIVDGWCHRQRLPRQIYARKNLAAFGDAGQTLCQYRRVDMVEVQVNMVLMFANAASFAHFKRHRTADHVA